MLINTKIYNASLALAEILQPQQLKLTVAESCTGGALGAAITAVPGSSAWFESGFITYNNEAKTEWLGVTQTTISQYGPVSEPVVEAMAEGARTRANADFAIAISGIAGPGGGSHDKPTGTICFGFSWDLPASRYSSRPRTGNNTRTRKNNCAITSHISGDRDAVREGSVLIALQEAAALIKKICIDIQ